ncbi:hypothetical protein [Actinomadura fibrosa]|uniref:DUF2207 domain-containing protein n=1 Tax=Actinomadura fibrosa TaxID=111802 RepID=A0ABW2XQK9_9ACTN|nr:hypothetical protein [Actinomadura fibrosa]
MNWEQAVFNNTAKDGSHVGVQGVLIGDNYTYVLSQNATPAERLAKARACLAALNAVPARALFKELIADEGASNELCYHLALSILSERPFGDLATDELQDLRYAFSSARRNREDRWSAPIEAIRSLVECRRQQEQNGVTSRDQLDDAVGAYRRLPEKRQNEIQTHLGLVMTGASLDRLEAEFAGRIRARRLAPDRKGRVWKFFEPVPEPPRARMPEAPTMSGLHGFMAACGAVLCTAGLLSVLIIDLVHSPGFALAVLALLGASGTLVVCLAPRQFPSRYLAASGAPPAPGAPHAAPPADPEFAASIEEAVRAVFHRHSWHAGAWSPSFRAHTRTIQAVLARELTELYAAPRIQPGAVDWLIRWHAGQAFRRWRAGELKKEAHSPFVPLGFTAGAVGCCFGTLFLLGGMVASTGGRVGLFALTIAVGAVLLAASGVDVYLVRRRRLPDERAAAARRREGEAAAYRSWCAVLADRPSDIEMARWLDDDKRHLMAMCRNQYGLSNADIIEHAVIAEPARGAQRARVRNGVWRYTAYVLWVYLLTEAGVRQIKISLDFATGALRNQRRTTFRYDAIASAGVEEVGERADDGLHMIATDPDGGDQGGPVRRRLRQSFHLALVNGESFEITVKRFEEPPPGPEQEDLPWLARLNLGPSGVVSTLKLLEEVAAEGGERVRAARRRRRVASFSDGPGHEPPRHGAAPNGTAEANGHG